MLLVSLVRRIYATASLEWPSRALSGILERRVGRSFVRLVEVHHILVVAKDIADPAVEVLHILVDLEVHHTGLAAEVRPKKYHLSVESLKSAKRDRVHE